ncbi:MAG TPA: hypothetical protein QF528_03265, partial [Phycisphaerales bacterium]|nr:hypothetical protein [Phycisphaerales bacterium]
MLTLIAALFYTTQVETNFDYPETRREVVVDTFHGVEVSDPYRWLEDDVRNNEEVAGWVEAENLITRKYLDTIKALPKIESALTTAWNYPKQSSPSRRGSRWFQSRNTGLQNHSVIYTGVSATDINEVLL